MTISTRDGLVDALGNSSTRVVINKASIANAVAGGFISLWRATGLPAQGAAPTTAAVPTAATTGAMIFANPAGAVRTYLARLSLACSNAAVTHEVHDRLAHMGGLSGTSVAAQTVGIDLTSHARVGAANFSECQWWIEHYTDTGGTGVNATCAVTYDDGSTGNVVVALAATTRASRMMPIIPAVAGRFIKAIGTVTLSATTGTVGNFGVTATRELTDLFTPVANQQIRANWADLGLPRVFDDSCLFLVQMAATTTTGVVSGNAQLAQG